MSTSHPDDGPDPRSSDPGAEPGRGESGDDSRARIEGERDAEPDARERARKERVLHTRISEQLAEDIRRVAGDLRVPVSNLVRNVLEETFSVVESVTENVGRFVEEVATEVDRARDRSDRGGRRPHRWARRFAYGTAGPDVEAWERPWDEPRREADVSLDRHPAEPSSPEPRADGTTPAAPVSDEGPPTAPQGDRAARPEFPDVLGWQALVLNRAQSCADCGRPLVRGDRACLGLTPTGVGSAVICLACMDARE